MYLLGTFRSLDSIPPAFEDEAGQSRLAREALESSTVHLAWRSGESYDERCLVIYEREDDGLYVVTAKGSLAGKWLPVETSWAELPNLLDTLMSSIWPMYDGEQDVVEILEAMIDG